MYGPRNHEDAPNMPMYLCVLHWGQGAEHFCLRHPFMKV